MKSQFINSFENSKFIQQNGEYVRLGSLLLVEEVNMMGTPDVILVWRELINPKPMPLRIVERYFWSNCSNLVSSGASRDSI